MTTKEAYWAENFHKQEASGLTQKDYCRQRKINRRQPCGYSIFHYWKGRLKSSETSGFIEIHGDSGPDRPELESLTGGKQLEVRFAKGFGVRFHLRWG